METQTASILKSVQWQTQRLNALLTLLTLRERAMLVLRWPHLYQRVDAAWKNQHHRTIQRGNFVAYRPSRVIWNRTSPAALIIPHPAMLLGQFWVGLVAAHTISRTLNAVVSATVGALFHGLFEGPITAAARVFPTQAASPQASKLRSRPTSKNHQKTGRSL